MGVHVHTVAGCGAGAICTWLDLCHALERRRRGMCKG